MIDPAAGTLKLGGQTVGTTPATVTGATSDAFGADDVAVSAALRHDGDPVTDFSTFIL